MELAAPTKNLAARTSWREVFFAMLVAVGCLACLVGYLIYASDFTTPVPVRLWKTHRAELEQFAEHEFARHTVGVRRIYGGGPSSGDTFEVPQFLLANRDVGYVEIGEGVMRIDFTFLPCDPVPVLAYCSQRNPNAGLPQPDPSWTYFKATELSQKWVYFEWDN
jgi:hypothetical protein